MVMVSKLSNFPDELSKNDKLREFELSGSDCTSRKTVPIDTIQKSSKHLCLLLKDNSLTTSYC